MHRVDLGLQDTLVGLVMLRLDLALLVCTTLATMVLPPLL